MKLVRVSTAFAAGLIIKMLLRVGNTCEATMIVGFGVALPIQQ
jgi:hypothetical protein